MLGYIITISFVSQGVLQKKSKIVSYKVGRTANGRKESGSETSAAQQPPVRAVSAAEEGAFRGGFARRAKASLGKSPRVLSAVAVIKRSVRAERRLC